MNNNRMGRVASELQKEISRIILYEMNDPRLGFITVTRTEPSPDLQCAKVFVTVLGNEAACKTSIDLLNNAANYIHSTLNKRIKLRYIPKLSFHFDNIVEEEQAVYRLLDKISQENAALAVKEKPKASRAACGRQAHGTGRRPKTGTPRARKSPKVGKSVKPKAAGGVKYNGENE
ncbi:MAG: 30S ribosome-binding factor RbfA [Planctomycetota bacterium]